MLFLCVFIFIWNMQTPEAVVKLSCSLCNQWGLCDVSSCWATVATKDSCCRAAGHLMSTSARWTHLMALPVVLFSREPCRRLERWFWAALQQQHGSQRKPSLKAKLIKSPITLLCLLTVCCHWGEAPLMRLRSLIHNRRLSNRKLLWCSCTGFTFLTNSQTREA